MPKNSDKIKSDQLGMNASTAQNQLRKKVFFDLVKKAGLNVCYRCSDLIEEESQLSLDHKTEWLHSANPYDLFFDLDNVAFSHLSCNSRAARNPSNAYSSSGSKGVYKIKDGKYRTQINLCSGGTIHLGCFDKQEDAAVAYDKAASELLGDRAVLNN